MGREILVESYDCLDLDWNISSLILSLFLHWTRQITGSPSQNLFLSRSYGLTRSCSQKCTQKIKWFWVVWKWYNISVLLEHLEFPILSSCKLNNKMVDFNIIPIHFMHHSWSLRKNICSHFRMMAKLLLHWLLVLMDGFWMTNQHVWDTVLQRRSITSIRCGPIRLDTQTHNISRTGRNVLRSSSPIFLLNQIPFNRFHR